MHFVYPLVNNKTKDIYFFDRPKFLLFRFIKSTFHYALTSIIYIQILSDQSD